MTNKDDNQNFPFSFQLYASSVDLKQIVEWLSEHNITDENSRMRKVTQMQTIEENWYATLLVFHTLSVIQKVRIEIQFKSKQDAMLFALTFDVSH